MTDSESSRSAPLLTPNWLAFLGLGIALFGIASASILIVIAEAEMGPNAITCNRLGFAAIAFGLWNDGQLLRSSSDQPNDTAHYRRGDIGLLILSGISFAASLTLCACPWTFMPLI